MKQIIINALKVDKLNKLSIEDKGKAIKQLKDRYNLSYREIERLTGYNKSTLQDWVTGRQKHVAGCLHVSIGQLINHFKIYEPKNLQEWCSLIELNKLLDKKIKSDSPKAKLDKQLGWEE